MNCDRFQDLDFALSYNEYLVNLIPLAEDDLLLRIAPVREEIAKL
jgi:hypothetical protein